MMEKPLDDEDLQVAAERVREAVLTRSGCATPLEFRRDAYERARHLSLNQPFAGSLDELSASYVDAVAENPRINAVDQLIAAGRSDDEVFELTVAAALGAATARLEAGLASLKTQK